MNKQLKELAEQAGYPDHMSYGQDLVLERFAELIIVKCANIVWDEAEKTMNKEVNEAGYKLLDSFGIKR